MVTASFAVDELAAVCGAEHVGAERGVFSVAPANCAEVAGVLRFAYEHGLAVNPWGGATKQDWAGAGEASIVLKMHRMNRVLEHPWQDMTCTVEAGCTWAAMQKELAKAGQFVGLDPVFAERASVGGICAVNDSGALRLKYGSLRDLVIGMTLVLVDGTVAKTGGKVVKNVAGYDLHKLMTGAFGTLAVITEVTFRLHSIPPYTASFTVDSSDAEPLGRMLLRVMDSHLSTQSVQMRSGTSGFSLDVALSTLPEVVEAQAAMLGTIAHGVGLTMSAAEADVWTAREGLFDETTGFVVKVTMLPAEIAGMVEAVSGLGGRSVTQAVGVMIGFIPASGAGGLMALRQRAERGRGSMVLLRNAEETSIDKWGSERDNLPLMREIKRQFDPKGILNPGGFVGGI